MFVCLFTTKVGCTLEKTRIDAIDVLQCVCAPFEFELTQFPGDPVYSGLTSNTWSHSENARSCVHANLDAASVRGRTFHRIEIGGAAVCSLRGTSFLENSACTYLRSVSRYRILAIERSAGMRNEADPLSSCSRRNKSWGCRLPLPSLLSLFTPRCISSRAGTDTWFVPNNTWIQTRQLHEIC